MIAKTASLTIAIILTYCGIHAEHPFLLHCLEGNSPTLSNIGDNVILCDLDDDDPTYPSCQTSQDDFDQDQKLKTLLEIVKRMELDKNQFGEESKGLNMSKFVHHLPNLDSLADMKKELEDKIHNLGVSRLVQKVRGILVVYCFTLFFALCNSYGGRGMKISKNGCCCRIYNDTSKLKELLFGALKTQPF